MNNQQDKQEVTKIPHRFAKVKINVIPLRTIEMNNSIFVGINGRVTEFHPNKDVLVTNEVAKVLRDATYPKYIQEEQEDNMGNKVMRTVTKFEPRYKVLKINKGD